MHLDYTQRRPRSKKSADLSCSMRARESMFGNHLQLIVSTALIISTLTSWSATVQLAGDWVCDI